MIEYQLISILVETNESVDDTDTYRYIRTSLQAAKLKSSPKNYVHIQYQRIEKLTCRKAEPPLFTNSCLVYVRSNKLKQYNKTLMCPYKEKLGHIHIYCINLYLGKVYLLCMQVWNEMEQRLHIGPPEPGSDREKEFNNGVQQIQSRLQNIIDKRRSGKEKDDVPFIDSLLQSSVPDEQVIMPYLMYVGLV